MLDFFKRYWPWLFAGTATVTGLAVALGGKKSPVPIPILPVRPPAFTGVTALTAYLHDDFFTELAAMAERWKQKGAKTSGDDILLMFQVESNAKASIGNKFGCLGLNQICPTLDAAHDPQRTSGLRKVGFQGSPTEYLALPEEKQLKFVEQYFINGNYFPHMRDVGSLYLTNFSPAFLGLPPNHVMYRQDDPNPKKAGAYRANAGVDFGKKGFIEVDDMRKFMEAGARNNAAKLAEMKARLALASGIA
jgi:hypothetical protein